MRCVRIVFFLLKLDKKCDSRSSAEAQQEQAEVPPSRDEKFQLAVWWHLLWQTGRSSLLLLFWVYTWSCEPAPPSDASFEVLHWQ